MSLLWGSMSSLMLLSWGSMSSLMPLSWGSMSSGDVSTSSRIDSSRSSAAFRGQVCSLRRHSVSSIGAVHRNADVLKRDHMADIAIAERRETSTPGNLRNVNQMSAKQILAPIVP
jgi:hypothetical protein